MYCGKNVYKVIVKLCEERGIGIPELADMCGMSKRAIYNIQYVKKVKIAIVVKICIGLNIRVQDFIDNPIFDEITD